MTSSPSRRAMLLDLLLIGAVMALTCGFYLARVGFYTDDWSFLATMSAAPDQSVVGLFHALWTPQVAMRPVQLIQIALLYRAFGLNPLGYHVVNSGVLSLSVLLMYVNLRGLGAARALAVAVALVYSTLPHSSTSRFMILTFQIPLCMLCYGLSVWASLQVPRARGYRWWGWLALALIGVVASGLAYEIALPLFLLSPPLVWFAQRRAPNRRPLRANVRLMLLATLTPATVVGVMLYKLRVTARLGTQPLSEQLGWIFQRAVAPTYAEYTYGLNIRQAFRIAYGDYGLSVPRLLAQILREYFDGPALLVSALVGLLVLAGLWRAQRADASPRRAWVGLALLGVVFFCAGYAIFLTNWNVGFSPTGIVNRTALAAALGVALTYVGLCGWLCSWITAECVRRGLFASGIALLCASNLLITLTIANFWIAANQQQQRALDTLTRDLPQLPENKIVLLEGMCAYVGPAPVFEAPWDLSGALKIRYRNPAIRADIISARTAVEGDGLANGMYGEVSRYPYDQFVIYNVANHKLSKIDDLDEANRHFARYNPGRSSGCPSGVEGHGVAVWDTVRARTQPKR